MPIIFTGTFEAGDWSEFDSTVIERANVAFVGGLAGSVKALQVTPTAADAAAYGSKTVGASLGTDILRYGYWLNDTGVVASGPDSISMLAGLDGVSPRFYQLHLYDASGDPQIATIVRNDTVAYTQTVYAPYPSGLHFFEHRIQRATGPADANGQMQVSVDGELVGEVTNLQLSTLSLPNLIRFGLGTVPRADNTTSPFMLDGLMIRNDDIPIFWAGRTNNNIAAIRNRQMHTNLRRGMTTGRRK